MAPTHQNRITQLDGVRGIAILMVLAFNSIGYFYTPSAESFWIQKAIDRIFDIGWAGVTLFFSLSGFLIGNILLNHRNCPRYYQTFFIRRACRILPLYLVIISPLVLIPLLKIDELVPQVKEPLSSAYVNPFWYLAFMQNNVLSWHGEWSARWIDTTWSLAVEEQFYLIAAFSIRLLPVASIFRWLSIAAASAIVIRIALLLSLDSHHAGVACYSLLPTRWDAMALGIMAAMAFRGEDLRAKQFFEFLSKADILFILSLLTLGFGLIYPDPEGVVMLTIGYSLFALFFSAFIYIAAKSDPGTVLNVLMKNRLLVLSGTISYGIYLLHEPILSFGFKLLFRRDRNIETIEDLSMALILCGISFAAATASWLLFEKHFLKIGKKFSYRNLSK